MYEQVYPTDGRKPVEVLHALLTEARVQPGPFDVTLGRPPFARDGSNRIVGIRLRFIPRATPTAVTTCPDSVPA